jgi:hypothetical protein
VTERPEQPRTDPLSAARAYVAHRERDGMTHGCRSGTCEYETALAQAAQPDRLREALLREWLDEEGGIDRQYDPFRCSYCGRTAFDGGHKGDCLVTRTRAALAAEQPAELRTITDEEAERWLTLNDLYAVTHVHDAPPDCAECNTALAAEQPDGLRLAKHPRIRPYLDPDGGLHVDEADDVPAFLEMVATLAAEQPAGWRPSPLGPQVLHEGQGDLP